MKKQMTPVGATCDVSTADSKASSIDSKKLLEQLKRVCTEGNSVESQRFRLIVALFDSGPKGITTIEARENLDVMAPAPRIFELRHKFGFDIPLAWSVTTNAQGNSHRCGRYVLMSNERRVKR